MAKYVIIILAALMAFLDYRAYLKLLRNNARKTLRKLFAWVIPASYFILFTSPFFMFMIRNENNNRDMMIFSMSIITFYIVFSVTRMIFYIFWLPSKRRFWTWTGSVISFAVLLSFPYRL